jgi:hypothetical protein
MRLSTTILGFVAAASLTASPAFAHAHPATGPGKPSTTGKPTTASKPAKPSTTHASAKPRSGSTSTRSSATTTTASHTTTVPVNPVAAKIASKPNLSAKVTSLLPTGPDGTKMSLNQASLGFKNQGQFIAALHVSRNLGIPFTELKSHMVTVTPGTGGAPATATQTGSLGQAIQAVKSTADATTETHRAETQADADLRNASATTTTTSKPKKPTQAGGR